MLTLLQADQPLFQPLLLGSIISGYSEYLFSHINPPSFKDSGLHEPPPPSQKASPVHPSVFFSFQHNFFIYNTVSQKDLQLTPAEIADYATHLPLSIIIVANTYSAYCLLMPGSV